MQQCEEQTVILCSIIQDISYLNFASVAHLILVSNCFSSNRSDLDSDMENVLETTELSAPGADGSCDEDVYVPIIPQRYLYVFDEAHFREWGS